MKPYPLQLKPILMPKVWGGRSLRALGKSLADASPLGESWELADLPALQATGNSGETVSQIANGPLSGSTLHDVINQHGEWLLGDLAPRITQRDSRFPLLVKYLDARENLSVQVHPSPAYALSHPEAHVKSEMWYIVDADDDAVIYAGLKDGVTRDQLAADAQSGQIVDDLCRIPVKPGESYYLPSGTCHAVGAGLVIAEIQTPSDTTYRLYDWGRHSREMHLDQGLAAIDYDAPCPSAIHARPVIVGAIRTTRLIRTDDFAVDQIECGSTDHASSDTNSSDTFEIETSNRPMVLMMLRGEGEIHPAVRGEPTVVLSAGTTVLIPAALRGATLELNECTLLRITLPFLPARTIA